MPGIHRRLFAAALRQGFGAREGRPGVLAIIRQGGWLVEGGNAVPEGVPGQLRGGEGAVRLSARLVITVNNQEVRLVRTSASQAAKNGSTEAVCDDLACGRGNGE